ncbi:MAG TPA: PqqD family protein [Blastocatellia bacterium]|nr:PqqD family protein [Blastocatellia bacterium]
MKDALHIVYGKSPNVVWRAIAGESLLVPIRASAADLSSIYSLNELGAFIWEALDGRRTVEDIIECVVREYDVAREDAERDVIEYLATLEQIGVIVRCFPSGES